MSILLHRMRSGYRRAHLGSSTNKERGTKYVIEYVGVKIVLGGDTFPDTWFVEYATDADFCIYECMPTPVQIVKSYNRPPQLAWRASGGFHTSPPAFVKVMSLVRSGYGDTTAAVRRAS